jgi:hypothetical protein
MPALSERKLEIVRTLVETAGDKVVEGLSVALASADGAAGLACVRGLVEAETRDRRLRNAVLAPLAPMCVADDRASDRLMFPSRVPVLLWRGLKAEAHAEVATAAQGLAAFRPGISSTEPFDRLTACAAQGVRARQGPDFCQAAELCEEARPGGAESLAACLDLAPVVRRVLPRLSDWTVHPSADAGVGSRLAYKDAVAIAPDGGPRFFRMLGAQMEHDWMVLRIISAVMERPAERFLAESELGVFGQQMLGEIEAAVKALGKIDLDGGVPAALAAARLVDRITGQAHELETYIELSRDRGWGQLLVKHRKALATVVEGSLRECEKYFAQALPTGRAKLQRIRRSIPQLNLPPDPRPVRRCLMLLTFVHEARHAAGHGGFAAARNKLLEILAEQLDSYVEELLDLVKTGEAENLDHAAAFFEVAAEASRLIRDDKAAELLQRRVASAFAIATSAAAATGT